MYYKLQAHMSFEIFTNFLKNHLNASCRFQTILIFRGGGGKKCPAGGGGGVKATVTVQAFLMNYSQEAGYKFIDVLPD